MADDIKYKIGFDPASKQMFFSDIETLKNVQSDLVRNFAKAVEEGLDVYKQFIDALKEGQAAGLTVDETLQKIVKTNIAIVDNIKPILGLVKELSDAGKSYEEIMSATNEVVKRTSASSKEWIDVLQTGLRQAGNLTGEFGRAMTGLAESSLKLVQNMDKLGHVGGWISLLSILGDVLKYLSDLDRMASQVNRSMYDIAAAMGDAGTKTGVVFIPAIAADLQKNFNLAREEAFGLVKNLADIGGREEEIRSIAEDVTKRFVMWSELKPEYQIKLMSEAMKNFGVTQDEANRYLKDTLAITSFLKSEFKDLGFDQKDFLDRAHQLTIATRQWGFELGDATKYLALSLIQVREVTGGLDIARASEIAQATMTTGLGNLAQLAYMAQAYGGAELRGKPLAGQLGAMLMADEGGREGVTLTERGEMQRRFITEMARIGGGGAPATAQEWMGGLALAQEQGVVAKMSLKATEDVAKLMHEGKFVEATTKMEKEAAKYAESGLNTANNTAKMAVIADLTKTHIEAIAHTVTAWYVDSLGARDIRRLAERHRIVDGIVTTVEAGGDLRVREQMDVPLRDYGRIAQQYKLAGRELPQGFQDTIQEFLRRVPERGVTEEEATEVIALNKQGIKVSRQLLDVAINITTKGIKGTTTSTGSVNSY